MNREDIIKLAREAGFNVEQGFLLRVTGVDEDLERFAALVAAAEREKVAAWMTRQGYATGHGDTIEDLLKELEWQIRERERNACAELAMQGTNEPVQTKTLEILRKERERIAEAIRARGQA